MALKPAGNPGKKEGCMQTKTNSNTKKSEPTIAFGGKAEPASGEQKALTENQTLRTHGRVNQAWRKRQTVQA